MVDFKNKLIADRHVKSNAAGQEISTEVDLEWAFESDRGRIINSAPIRRLQQKTQVFPLERNAAVRSRLTHSLEVQQTGRFITREIFKRLKHQNAYFGLKPFEREVESLVEMACLMHDMGNPPFGHFGEAAISSWFKKTLPQLPVFKDTSKNSEVSTATKLRSELGEFEGNAQAIRIVAHLQKLNLTYAQAACILKYTRVGTEPKPAKNDPNYYLKKKPGYYQSEAGYVEKLQSALTIKPNHRYPFTYIMEAADDISYCLADLEDGVDKRLLSYQKLARLLVSEFQALRHTHGDAQAPHFNGQSFEQLIEQALASATAESVDNEHAFFVSFRVGLIHPLVQHAANAFVDNIDAVYEGSLKRALLEDNSPQHAVIQSLKNVAAQYIFKAAEVETLELQGYQILTGILDRYAPLLHLTKTEFESLAVGSKSNLLVERLLFRRLPEKHVKAYKVHCATIDEQPELWEMYYRCRLLQDMVSGMTDQFALDEYQVLHAMRHD